MTLAQYIQKHRKDQDKTQNDLAESSGLARSYIARLERGDYEEGAISLATFVRLAKALEIPMYRFFQEVEFTRSTNLPPLGMVLKNTYARSPKRKRKR